MLEIIKTWGYEMRTPFKIMIIGASIAAALPATAQEPAAVQDPAAQEEPAIGGPADAPDYLTDTQADLTAILDARIAALKTVLQMTAEQEALWAPVESAIRDSSEKAHARAEARYTGEQPTNFLQVLTRITESEAERGAGINAFVEAFQPLAAELSEEQMRRVPPFLGLVDTPYGEQPSGQLWIVED